MIIDSLTHITGDGTWVNGRDDASLDRLITEMDRANVSRAVLVGIAGFLSNDEVLAAAKGHPQRFIPVAGFDPSRERLEVLPDLAASGFRGLKLHPRLNRYDPEDARVVDTIREAHRLGLPVFFCTMTRRRGLKTRHVADIADALMSACEDARVVFLHGGGPSVLEMSEALRPYPTALLDLAFTLNRYAGSSVDTDIAYLCRTFDERMSLGSDMPEYTPAATLARFDALTPGLPETKRRRILGLNLAAIFNIVPDAAQETL